VNLLAGTAWLRQIILMEQQRSSARLHRIAEAF